LQLKPGTICKLLAELSVRSVIIARHVSQQKTEHVLHAFRARPVFLVNARPVKRVIIAKFVMPASAPRVKHAILVKHVMHVRLRNAAVVLLASRVIRTKGVHHVRIARFAITVKFIFRCLRSERCRALPVKAAIPASRVLLCNARFAKIAMRARLRVILVSARRAKIVILARLVIPVNAMIVRIVMLARSVSRRNARRAKIASVARLETVNIAKLVNGVILVNCA